MLRCVYWRSRGAPQATTISQYPCASRWSFPSDREHLKGQDLRRPQLTMIGAAGLIARCFLAEADVNKFVGASTGCVRVKWGH